MHSTPPQLLGDYTPPNVEKGDWLFCEFRGTVQVGGHTDAPIPWPRLLKTGLHVHIMCGDLIKAIQTESSLAIQYWFGVSRGTVSNWRRALGVGRNTLGTFKLAQEMIDVRMTEEEKERGRTLSKRPEAIAKLKASKTGKPAHPNSLEALDRGRRQKRSKAVYAQMGKVLSQKWANGEIVHPNAWSDEELGLLGTDTDSAIAEKLGRSIVGVAHKRRRLGIKSFKRKK